VGRRLNAEQLHLVVFSKASDLEGQLLLIDHISKHLLHVIEFAFAVAVRVVNPVINQPKLVHLGIDIHAAHHADAFDHGLGVAAVLRANQLHGKRVILVQYGIIKDDEAAHGVGTICPCTLSQTSRGVTFSPPR
jgi:hypothetical protein